MVASEGGDGHGIAAVGGVPVKAEPLLSVGDRALIARGGSPHSANTPTEDDF